MSFELTSDIALPALETYLRQQNWLAPNAKIKHLEKPGDGNMNVVLRVQTDEQPASSLILKQARPFVWKYPQVAAPVERAEVECRFYQLAHKNRQLRGFLPRLIGFDSENHLLALEDLGRGRDYTYLYGKKNERGARATISLREARRAITFLNRLHNTAFSEQERLDFPQNLALRRLNHEHLFVYPYLSDNGLNLDTIQPGLAEVAKRFKNDASLQKGLAPLGELYLSSGKTLLHGDFYPGSWFLAPNGEQGTLGFRVIDPEFCFFGPAEYDLGVLVAHLKLALTPESRLQTALDTYEASPDFSKSLVFRFAGMEILRRILGLAQLPLTLTLAERTGLLEQAAAWVRV